MTFFWGSNFSIIKTAIREMPGPAFNGLRMVLASIVFLAIIGWRDGLRAPMATVERKDWPAILVLSLVGHGLYQVLFLGGVARTSVANSSLIFGLTPVTVSLLGAWLGHERPGWTRWAGTALSLFGIYLVVAHAEQGTSSLTGDLLIFGAMLSWAIYTVGTRPLLERYSPVFITGLTMAIGSVDVRAVCAALAARRGPVGGLGRRMGGNRLLGALLPGGGVRHLVHRRPGSRRRPYRDVLEHRPAGRDGRRRRRRPRAVDGARRLVARPLSLVVWR